MFHLKNILKIVLQILQLVYVKNNIKYDAKSSRKK